MTRCTAGRTLRRLVDVSLKDPRCLAFAQAYLRFLFDEPAQEIASKLGHRPTRLGAAEKAGVTFPAFKLIPVTAVARDWTDAAEDYLATLAAVRQIRGLLPVEAVAPPETQKLYYLV